MLSHKKIASYFMVLSLLFTSSWVYAATYEIDPAHSSVTFKIRHLVGKVKGRFNKFQGTIEFDENNQAASSVKARIDLDSIDTQNADRDMHLRTADFFDTSNFQKVTFDSKAVDVEKKKLVGDLTMHGVTREVSLDYSFNGLAPDQKGRKHLGGSGVVELKRQDFGINYDPGALMLGSEVTVEIEIEAIEKEEA